MSDDIIKWNSVDKSFGENKVLDDLTLSVKKGETLTIIGGSGSGKSIMLKILLGIIEPDSGNVFFGNKDIAKMNEKELIEVRKQMGMLFQGGALFDSLTVSENIAYPLNEHFDYDDDEIAKIVAEKLDLVGLSGIEDMKPADLSGGMQKRVALARAIATEPHVILYDEPTTGLDPANTMRINKLVKDIQKKLQVTSVVVTHDMESAFFVSDRMAMLYNSNIEFVGSPDEARNSDKEIVKNFIKGQVGDDAGI